MSSTAQELRETVHAAFAHYDDDHSGSIDARELQHLVADLGGYLTDNELETVLLILDRDRNGSVDEHEFTAWWMAQGGDLDGDRTIGEFEKAMARLKDVGQARFRVDVHSAAWRGDADAVARMLQDDSELASTRDATEYGVGNIGNTPLHYAAYQGHAGVCTMLVNCGASANAVNAAGCSPLFLAAQQSRKEVVALLLKSGADIRVREKEHKLTAVDVTTDDEILALFRAMPGAAPRAPNAPTLSTSANESSLRVEWSPPGEKVDQLTPVSGYKLKFVAPASMHNLTLHVAAHPCDYLSAGLQPDTEYIAYIAAINLHGISSFSEPSALVRTRRARPGAPIAVTARITDAKRVSLTWMPLSTVTVSHYVVQQAVDEMGSLWKNAGTTEGDVGTFVIHDTFCDQLYHFRVAAVIGASQGQFSEPVKIRTPPSAKPTPIAGNCTARPRLDKPQCVGKWLAVSVRAPNTRLQLFAFVNEAASVVQRFSQAKKNTIASQKKFVDRYPVPEDAVDSKSGLCRSIQISPEASALTAQAKPIGASSGVTGRAEEKQEKSARMSSTDGQQRRFEATSTNKDSDSDDYAYFSDDEDTRAVNGSRSSPICQR